MEPITFEVSKKVFDLDAKDDITLFKPVTFTPATDTQDALSRVGNDASTFMKIVNAGLKEFTGDQARNDNSVAWQAKDDEENYVPFTGTPISEEMSKQLAVQVLGMAKLMYGYEKSKPREEKKNAKEQALADFLANPAIVERLKKG